jgi:hypothetical protein
MSTRNTDALVRLIWALSKSEKRSFKLYANRNSSSLEELNYLKLFDLIDKNPTYTDDLAIEKIKSLKKSQISNTKNHLYKQLLISLRLQHASHLPQIEVREMIDYAMILYEKGFYSQASKLLDKAKQLATKIQSTLLQLEIVEFEKLIESHHVSKNIALKANELTTESNHLSDQIGRTTLFSNLSIQLYALYVKLGFVRDEKDYIYVKEFFEKRIPDYELNKLNFEEKIHLFTANVWYYYITQDFLMCFKYASLWVKLFEDEPEIQVAYREMYLKGLYNLQNVLFNLRNHRRLNDVIVKLENVDLGNRENENLNLLHKMYWLIAKINDYYLCGKFTQGLSIVPKVNAFIETYQHTIDNHRIMILYYKVACLYFGSGDNKECIKYLNQIIQMRDVNAQEDIQAFARILNLIAHFEMGKTDDSLEYQIKSVYRFLRNMGDLHGVQKEILSFLRQLPFADEKTMMRAFRILHAKLVKLSKLPYEKRPFLYLDIISWLECKLEKKNVQDIIRSKFLTELETGQSLYFPE